MNNLENKLKQLIDARINALSKRVEDRIIYIDNKASSGIIDTEEKTEQNNTQIKEMEEQIAQNEESIEDLSKLIEENATNIAENEENISLNKVSIAELKQIIGNIQNSKYYNVIIDSDGGNINDDYVKMQGAKVSHPGTPSKEGYRFIDWFIGDNECYFPIPIEDKTIIVAKWNKIIYYTVVYEENGGIEVDDITLENGTVIQEPKTTRSGYNFRGWYSDSGFQDAINFPYTVVSDITMYAKWEEIIYYTITFDTDGGTEIESITAEEGTLIEIPTPQKEDATFLGWYLDAEFTTEVHSPIELTSNMTLYAKFELDTPSNSIKNLTVKYVRDSQWGNPKNKWANWSEIIAMKNGVNVAQGCYIIQSWDGRTYNNSTITDGKIDTQYLGKESSGNKNNPLSVTVILKEPTNLDSIIVARPSGSTYYNRILVSADETTWYVLYDSDIDGVYTEPENGREFTTYYM